MIHFLLLTCKMQPMWWTNKLQQIKGSSGHKHWESLHLPRRASFLVLNSFLFTVHLETSAEYSYSWYKMMHCQFGPSFSEPRQLMLFFPFYVFAQPEIMEPPLTGCVRSWGTLWVFRLHHMSWISWVFHGTFTVSFIKAALY